MAGLARIDKAQRINISIPESLRMKVQIELFSELEGRVPHGRFSGLISDLLAEWLRDRGIDA